MKKRIFRETDGIRGKVGEEPLTETGMYQMGRAIGRYFKGEKILMGRDTRESGGWMDRELNLGVADVGGEVWNVGQVTTPCVGFLTKTEGVEGGVMVTASHNPASDNGVKVFGGDGDKLPDDEELKIEDLFFEEDSKSYEQGRELPDEKNKYGNKVVDRTDLVDKYLAAVTDGVDLKGWKICIDSAAGGGWQLVRRAFEGVGAEVIEVGPVPDGKNINDGCGAAFPEKIADAVVREGADMGVAFDGDADRLIIADNKGKVWDGDRIVVLLALWLKERGELTNNIVVMTEYSNHAAVLFLEEQGVRVDKVVNGDRAVAEKCEELGAILGGEVAGHVIYLKWMTASDGLFTAMLVAKMVRESGRTLEELRPDYENFPKKIWNLAVKERKPLEEVAGWSEELAECRELLGSEGRVFARYSGTEDLLRILVEAKDETKMRKVGERLSRVMEEGIGK